MLKQGDNFIHVDGAEGYCRRTCDGDSSLSCSYVLNKLITKQNVSGKIVQLECCGTCLITFTAFVP